MDLNLKWCWNLLAEGSILVWNCIRIECFFQTITAFFSNKYCNLSTEMHKVRPHFLYGISRLLQNTTWDHRYWRIVCEKMPNPCPKCTLSTLSGFNFFGILKSAKSFRKLDEIHNCLQPMSKSLSLWFPLLGDRKAGTSRSHVIGRYELD